MEPSRCSKKDLEEELTKRNKHVTSFSLLYQTAQEERRKKISKTTVQDTSSFQKQQLPDDSSTEVRRLQQIVADKGHLISRVPHKRCLPWKAHNDSLAAAKIQERLHKKLAWKAGTGHPGWLCYRFLLQKYWMIFFKLQTQNDVGLIPAWEFENTLNISTQMRVIFI